MRLVDLNPKWVGSGGEGISTGDGRPVPPREGVAIMFDCPCGGHEDAKGDETREFQSRVFVHIDPAMDGKPADESSKPAWKRTGDSFENLTLEPSIQRVGGWHGFVRNGEIVNA
jgi:hypothetical protein